VKNRGGLNEPCNKATGKSGLILKHHPRES